MSTPLNSGDTGAAGAVGTCLPRPRPGAARGGAPAGVWFYFGTLTLASSLGDPTGLLTLPLQFTLKDQLGLSPRSLAVFETLAFIPIYLGFAFGFLRDRWRPFGDRGYLFLGGLAALPGYLWLASSPVTYGSLLAGVLLAVVAYQVLDVASDALLTAVARRHFMTGRLSAVVEAGEAVPGIVAVLAGGWMAAHTSLAVPLLAAAACSMAVVAHTFWYPPGVYDERASRTDTSHRAELARLLAHAPLRGAVAVAALWNLSLSWGTPFLFYVSGELALSSEVLGLCRAAGLACALAMAPIYGVLCQQLTLKRSLQLAVGLGLLPGFLFLAVSTPSQAVAVAVLVGLPTAFGHMALFDLLRRACPRDLEGTALAVSYSALALAAGAGDVSGAWLYERGGFLACLVAEAMLNAAVLPLLAVVPAGVLARREVEDEAP